MYISKFKQNFDPSVSFFKEYILAFNPKLNFTDTEINLLAEILYYNSSTNPNNQIVELDSKARKVISNNLGITVYNFNNVFQRLKTRGVFSSLDESKQYKINIPVFQITPKEGDVYTITYTFEIQ